MKKYQSIASQSFSRSLENYWVQGLIELVSGLVYAVIGGVVLWFVNPLWERLSPSKQYLLAAITFRMAVVALYEMMGYWLSHFVGVLGFGISMSILLVLFSPRNLDSPLRRLEEKYIVSRTLYRNYVTRTCMICGYFDSMTRDLTIPANKSLVESAYAPCKRCGATTFRFHRLDYEPQETH